MKLGYVLALIWFKIAIAIFIFGDSSNVFQALAAFFLVIASATVGFFQYMNAALEADNKLN